MADYNGKQIPNNGGTKPRVVAAPGPHPVRKSATAPVPAPRRVANPNTQPKSN